MLILNGAFRGEEAEMLKLNESKFSCDVKISAVSNYSRIVITRNGEPCMMCVLDKRAVSFCFVLGNYCSC
mgnify:FL=1